MAREAEIVYNVYSLTHMHVYPFWMNPGHFEMFLHLLGITYDGHPLKYSFTARHDFINLMNHSKENA